MAKGQKTHKLTALGLMDLRIIRALSKNNYAAAAKELGVSIPLIAIRLRMAENYFQQPIYFRQDAGRPRSDRPMPARQAMTPFGLLILKYAEEILDLYTEMMVLGRSYNPEAKNVAVLKE